MKNEKLPHYLKSIIVSDPELVAILTDSDSEDSARDSLFKSPDFKTALTGVLLGTSGFELFKKILPDLVDESEFNVTFLKECLYLAVPFLGTAAVYPFLKELAKFVGKNELSLSVQNFSALDDSSANDLRHRIFDSRTGFGISENDAGNSFKKSIDEFVFRKFYGRTLLTYRQKELLALFIVISSHSSSQTLTEHVNAALKTGNIKEELISLVENTAIFSGYLRAAEAIRAIRNAKKPTVITSLDKVRTEDRAQNQSQDLSAYSKDADKKAENKSVTKTDEKHAENSDKGSKKKSKKEKLQSSDKALKTEGQTFIGESDGALGTNAADVNASADDNSENDSKKNKLKSKQKKSHKK